MISGVPLLISSLILFSILGLLLAILFKQRMALQSKDLREKISFFAMALAVLSLFSALLLNLTWVSADVSQGLGTTSVRLLSLTMFFSSIFGCVLGLFGRGTRRLLSCLVCLGVGIWWITLYGTAAISMGSVLTRHPVKYIIPSGYHGWIRIRFGVSGTPALTLAHGTLLCRIPSSGVLETSSKIEEGWASDKYLELTPTGNELEFRNTTWGGGGMIWGEATESTGNIGAADSEVFFVGTEEQYKNNDRP